MEILSGTKSALGDNTVITNPGNGMRIVLRYVTIQNEGVVPVTVLFKDGSTQIGRFILPAGSLPFVVPCPAAEWAISQNSAFVMNLSVAAVVNYNINYTTR